MERNAFLARVREAAAAGRAYQVAHNPEATADASYVGGGDDPVGTFLQEWTAVGGNGLRVQSIDEAHDFLKMLIEKHGVKSALCWKHPFLERLDIANFLQGEGVEVRLWDQLEQEAPVQRWQQTFSADLGITSVDWAIAETGSLALRAQSGQGRSVSLVPPLHVALLEPSQIVPDLFDLFRELETHKAEFPSNITLITGPSKTGDIQLKLTTGVHGPGEVHAVVIESA
jgi:L-lactate utilization protein LutC